jgi:hypothetical protein
VQYDRVVSHFFPLTVLFSRAAVSLGSMADRESVVDGLNSVGGGGGMYKERLTLGAVGN